MADHKPSFLSRWSQRKAQARKVVPPEPEVTTAPEPPTAQAQAHEQAQGETATRSDPRPGVACAAAIPLRGTHGVQPLGTSPGTGASSVVGRPENAPGGPTALSPGATEEGHDLARRPSPAPDTLPTMDDVARLGRQSDYSRFVARGVDAKVRNAAMKKLFADPHFNIMDGLDIYIDDYSQPDPISPEMLRSMTQSKTLRLFEDEEPPEEDVRGAVEAPLEQGAGPAAEEPSPEKAGPAANAPAQEPGGDPASGDEGGGGDHAPRAGDVGTSASTGGGPALVVDALRSSDNSAP